MALAAKVVHLGDHKEKHMGKPQTEDGYTRIANELFDQIILAKITGRQLRVLLAIIRKTYGFNKKSDEIGLSQLRDMTGMDRSNVGKAVNELVSCNILVVSGGSSARTISINKAYRTWKVETENDGVVKTTTVVETTPVVETTTQGVVKTTHSVWSKQPPQKTSTKDNKKTYTPAAEKSAPVLLKTWLSAMAEKGEKAISPQDTVFEYAEQAGISDDMMRICWLEFRARNIADNKRKKDWRAHFRNAVRGNWYRLWAFDGEGKAFLTSQGRQAMNVFKGE